MLWVALNSIFIILRLFFEIGKITLHIWKKCNTMVTVFCMEVSIGTRVEPIIFAILMTVMPITLAICTTIWSKRKFELLPTIYIMFQNSYTRLLIFFVLRITPAISSTIVRIASAILHWKWVPLTAQILEILKCLKNSVYSWFGVIYNCTSCKTYKYDGWNIMTQVFNCLSTYIWNSLKGKLV